MPHIDCHLFSRRSSTAMPLDDVGEPIADAANFIWLELQSPDTATIPKLGEDLGLHELVLEDGAAQVPIAALPPAVWLRRRLKRRGWA